MANKAGEKFSQWEDAKVKELYEVYGDTVIAEIICRPPASVRSARKRLGLERKEKSEVIKKIRGEKIKRAGSGYAMTIAQMDIIREEYQSYSDDNLAVMIGKSPSTVRDFRKKENLVRSTYLRSKRPKQIPVACSPIQKFLSMRL